jgi:hypothetical protein
LSDEDRTWLTEEELNRLMLVEGNTRDARPVISRAMVKPETIFSERDIFMVFLRSGPGARKRNAEP